MKLYDSRLAPNPRRVRWFMAEKGIDDIEIDSFDLFGGRHKTPEYLAEVGVPQAPALVLDHGEAITESVAICRYLEALYPEPNLFGVGALETARIEMWTRRAELTAAHPMMTAVRHGQPTVRLGIVGQAAAEAAQRLALAIQRIEGNLADRCKRGRMVGGKQRPRSGRKNRDEKAKQGKHAVY